MSNLRKIYNWISGKYYSSKIRRRAASCGERLYVGGKSYVTSNTYLGEHVCFNGMAISGSGKVMIGSYFHSGPGCQIITSFHNYEGDAIPYDDTYVNKDVEIGDCVWLGNNVIILGGGENWRRSDNSSWLSSVQRYSAICGSRWPSGNSVQI